MAFIVDEFGNIETYQGDSGTLVVEELPTDRNYSLYFSIYNDKRQIIGETEPIALNGATMKSIPIEASLTDLLTVPKDEDYAEYYYGLKLCVNGEEDTLIIDDGDIGSLNIVRVYPKKVEGV